MKNFFSKLESEYQIKSDIFVNGNFLPTIIDEVDSIIALLNDKEDKSIASRTEIKQLEKKISDAEQKYSYEIAVSEIDNYVERGYSGKLSGFRTILSICATQMLLEYGFRNKIFINLKFDGIDTINCVIIRGRYTLPIPNSIIHNLKEYIRIRNYLLSVLEVSQEKLFVKYDGSSIDDSGAADKLFSGVMGEDESKASTSFAKNCIKRMIDAGLNEQLISEITGHGNSTIKNVCDLINKNNNQNKITEFIIPTKSDNVKKLHYMDCPLCRKKSIKEISSEFVLLKKPGDENL